VRRHCTDLICVDPEVSIQQGPQRKGVRGGGLDGLSTQQAHNLSQPNGEQSAFFYLARGSNSIQQQHGRNCFDPCSNSIFDNEIDHALKMIIPCERNEAMPTVHFRHNMPLHIMANKTLRSRHILYVVRFWL